MEHNLTEAEIEFIKEEAQKLYHSFVNEQQLKYENCLERKDRLIFNNIMLNFLSFLFASFLAKMTQEEGQKVIDNILNMKQLLEEKNGIHT